MRPHVSRSVSTEGSFLSTSDLCLRDGFQFALRHSLCSGSPPPFSAQLEVDLRPPDSPALDTRAVAQLAAVQVLLSQPTLQRVGLRPLSP